jgi:hypothetical protein
MGIRRLLYGGIWIGGYTIIQYAVAIVMRDERSRRHLESVLAKIRVEIYSTSSNIPLRTTSLARE